MRGGWHGDYKFMVSMVIAKLKWSCSFCPAHLFVVLPQGLRKDCNLRDVCRRHRRLHHLQDVGISMPHFEPQGSEGGIPGLWESFERLMMGIKK